MSAVADGSSALLRAARRLVVKIGSSLLTNDGRGLDQAAISAWADQIARLTLAGRQVVLVSSGAIAEGMSRLGWQRRPQSIHELVDNGADHSVGVGNSPSPIRVCPSTESQC